MQMSTKLKIEYYDASLNLTVDGLFKDYKLNIPANYQTACKGSGRYKLAGGIVVGLPKVGSYDHRKFIDINKELPSNFKYILGLNSDKIEIAFDEYKKSESKFIGLKIHPGLIGKKYYALQTDSITSWLKDRDMVLGVCTYTCWDNLDSTEKKLFFYKTEKIIRSGVKVIFYHSFFSEFLEYYREFGSESNAIFDTSFTTIRVNKVCLEEQIELISQGNENIVFGTDFPDYNVDDYDTYLTRLRGNCTKDSFDKYMRKNLINMLSNYD